MGEVAPTPMLPSAAFQATGQDIVGASLDQSSPKPAQPTAKCRNCESSESTRSLQMQALEVRNTEQQVNATWQRTWDLQIKAYKDHDAELTADHAQMALKLAVAEATLKVTEKERMDAEQRLDYLKAQMSAERQAALKEMNQLESSLTIQIETLQEQLVREKERMAAQMKEERVSIQQGMLRDRVLSEKELQRQVEEERAKSAELQSNLKKLMQNTNDQNRIDVVK
eukprot:gene14427-17057_t